MRPSDEDEKMLSVRDFPVPLRKRIKKLAIDSDYTMREHIIDAISEYCNKWEAIGKASNNVKASNNKL
jgi:hypothetical protein